MTAQSSSPRRIVLATRNAHKLGEMQRILIAAGANVELVPLSPDAPDPVESGNTFAANAMIKARSAADAMGMPAIADDSGICVDALNGMPGILSARWAGRHGDDAANLALLVAQVADVPEARRGAQFVCAIAYVDDERAVVVEGVQEGRLADQPRGAGGFGYDPVFIGLGQGRTNAELAPYEKDAVSHRGSAVRTFVAEVLER
jgi:XTP/dITP diphosphohydrolase